MADLLETLPAYTDKDYPALLAAIRWLFDESRQKTQYHNGHLEAITLKWSDKPMRNLETFKKYQLKFTKVAGGLQQQGQLSSQEMDRRFWDGICDEARDRLERRMIDINPRLNTSTPYTVKEIAAAAEHIYDRNRFDKHLREREPTTRFTTPSSRRKKGKKKAEETDSESDSESETDQSDEEPTPREKERTKEKAAYAAAARKETPKRNTKTDEINDLVTQMENLSISPTTYRTLFVRLKVLAPEICEYYPPPFTANVGSYMARDTRSPPGGMQREPLPHQRQAFMSQDARVGERRTFTCFGCGDKGHRMDDCEKIEAFVQQGHVKRLFGKLRWNDGSNIFREPEESWAQAIVRRIQNENKDRGQEKGTVGRSVYYIEVGRENSDADTEEQEELGWVSGATSVSNLQAYNVDRAPRVSKDTRKKTARDVPPGPHRVKEFSLRGHRDDKGVGKDPFTKNMNKNRSQDWLQRTSAPTPVDVTQNEFKGESDGEMVPMDVEEFGIEQRVNNRSKAGARNDERPIRDAAQARAKKGKTQSELIDQIMRTQLTMPLKDIALISPSVRRDLAGTLKAMRDDAPDGRRELPEVAKGGEPTLPGPEGIKVMKMKRSGEEMRELVMDTRGGREARKELLKLKATVGEARMMGIVDSGSMASMISAERLEASGLPSKPLGDRSFKVTGMDGGVGYCRAWVEAAKIYVTPSGLETTSDLYVLENADFDLLLGRPWMTFNEVNIMERQRGTYVSWMSGSTRYEINASKAKRVKLPRVVRRPEAMEGNTEESDNNGDRVQTVTAYTVRSVIDYGTDRSYIPWSIETREGPDYLEEEGEPEEDEEMKEMVRRKAQAKVETWSERKREEEGEADDEREEGKQDTGDQWDANDEPEEGEVREQKFPASQPGAKGEKATYTPPDRAETGDEEESEGIIVIDRNLEEDFASLVQEEANENDWERFCIKERRRLAKRQKTWLDWIDSDNDEPMPARTISQKDGGEDQIYDEREGPEEPSPPREQTPVLESPPQNRPKTVSSKEDKRQAVTTEIEARRSQRVRQRTVKGQYADEKEAWREYRREERASKTVSKHKRQKTREETLDEPFGGPRLRSFCLVMPDDPKQDEEDRLREEEWVSGPRNHHWSEEARQGTTQPRKNKSHEDATEGLPEELRLHPEDLASRSHDSQATYKPLPLVDTGNPEEPCTEQREGFAETTTEWDTDRRGVEIDGLSIIEPMSNLIYEYETEEPTV